MPAFTATYNYETDSNLLSGMTFTHGSTTFAQTTYGYGINRNVKTDVRNQVDMGSGWSDVSGYQYRYDGDRRRTDVVNTGSAFAQNALRLWDYNSRSEVIGQSRYLGVNPESPGGAVIEQNFGYGFDNIGNRLISVTEAGGVNETTRTYASNALNQYTSITNPNASPVFDEDGNMIYDGVKWYYEWDAENRLIEARTYETTPSNGDERLSFVYDYQSRRVSKIVESFDGSAWETNDNLKFLYQGWNLLLEIDENSDNILKTYLWGMDLSGTSQGAGGVGGLLGMVDTVEESAMVVFYDANGNVTQLYDWLEEEIVAHYEYDPFGGIVNVSGDYAQENVFRFSTKYLDVETELYYYGYRYYEPVTGRWLNRDPIGEEGGLNLYGFVGNDPILWIDYLGLTWKMRCVRCTKKNGDWMMTCGLFNDTTGESHSVTENDYDSYVEGRVGNQKSEIEGDPYGRGGPLEPGDYQVTLDNSNTFGKNIPSVSNDDRGSHTVTTSQGNQRDHIRIHPQMNFSDGCITCNDTKTNPINRPALSRFTEDRRSPFVNNIRDAVRDNGGSLPLGIVDAGDCPCSNDNK